MLERHLLEGDLVGLSTVLKGLQQQEQFDELYDAASLLIDYGFFEQADEIYDILITYFPNEAQLKIDRATTLLELGDEDQALLLLTEIPKDDDQYVQALLALADYYDSTGMAETALAKIEEARAISPNEPIIRFAHAELLLNSGKYAEAARLYEELRQGREEIAGVSLMARLAEVYSAGGAFEEAIPYYEALLEQRPLPDTLFEAAYAYFQTEQYERAKHYLEQLLTMDIDYFSAYMLLGQTYAHLGNDQQAYEQFVKGIQRDEYVKELRLAAGKSALKLGLASDAESHLLEALALDPEYVEALITLASFYNEREEDEKLIELLRATDSENSEIALIHAFYAYAYERQEQFEKAYVSYSKAYVGLDNDPAFLDRFATFLLEEGRQKEALVVIRQLVIHLPDAEEWTAYLEAQDHEEV